MPKVIVTHLNPDFDGIPAIWLLHRFHPDFRNAKVEFAPAGSTIDGKPAGSNPDVIHVDTGGGPFDHHNTNEYTCAAKLVWDWLKKELRIEDLAIERLIAQVVAFDHAKDLLWSDAADDKYDLTFPALITGMKMAHPGEHDKFVEWGERILDWVYLVYKAKIDAEKELQKGKKFPTRWGEAIGCQTGNEMIMHLGEKLGYSLVVRKDPKRGHIRIYGRNDRGVDLIRAFAKLKRLDPKATWFLHASHCLLLNGSGKRNDMVPTKLSLDKVIEVLKNE